MTPLRQRESLNSELIGLERLLSITPDDPLATPLMQSRAANLRKQISQLEDISGNEAIPETEIFFKDGPVIGSRGIEANFAGKILRGFQKMVTNHFSAKFRGGLRMTGKRKGESDSALFLTALPTSSFGLQLTRPGITDLFAAGELAQAMEDVTGLVNAAGKDDQYFVDTISNFNARVLVPLEEFLETMNNSGADCRMISGNREVRLNKEEVAQAYERVKSRKEEIDTITHTGIFWGTLPQSGRFEFQPHGESLFGGWLSEHVTEDQAVEWDRQLTRKVCHAKIRRTKVTTQTGKRNWSYELLDLTPAQILPENV